MDRKTIKRFADLLLTLAPDFPMTPSEIQQRLKEKGVDDLFDNAEAHSASLIETIKLLSLLEKGAVGSE